VITAVRPRVVMLELCPSRFAAMFPRRRPQDSPVHSAPADIDDPGAMVDQGTQTVNKVLSGINQFMAFLGMTPGCDFVAGVDAARHVGARLVLGDRDAFETMEEIARLKALSGLLDMGQIIEGVRGLRDAVSPATQGRISLPEVLLVRRRIQEALPILSIPAVALWLSAVLAWSTESLFGVSR